MSLAKNALAVVVGGLILGLVLDEAGQGKFGALVKMIAQKSTRGFGVGA